MKRKRLVSKEKALLLSFLFPHTYIRTALEISFICATHTLDSPIYASLAPTGVGRGVGVGVHVSDMDPSFDLPITRAVHYGGPTAKPEEKPRPEPRAHQPPIVMPCMSLDLSALLQAKGTPYQQIAQGWDEARADEEAAERAAHGFPPLPEGEAKVQFPADDNFWRCLQRLVKMIPGAQEKPAYAIEARSKTDVLTVNKDFLALFRVAWANEFPVELTVCLNESGKPQVAVFSVNATVWHEILLHSNGYAPLEHSQRAIPKGFVLCTSTADEAVDGAQRPLSLTIDAWRGVCDVWPEQTPNPEDLAKFSPEGDRPPQGRLFSPRQTGPSALNRIVMPDARSAALLAAAPPQGGGGGAAAAARQMQAPTPESEGDRQRQLLADLPSSKQFASTSTADAAVAALRAAPPTPQQQESGRTPSSAFDGPPQPSLQSTEQPRQRLQPGSEELPVEAERLAANDVGGRVAGAGYDSDEEASVATSSLFSDASSSVGGAEPTAAAAAAAALKAAGFLNDSELPPTRAAARGVDETLHARVLAIEAAQIREDLEKEQTTVRKEQAMTIARLEAQVLRLQAGEQQQQQQEPSMLPSAGIVQKQKQLSTYASGFSSVPTTYEATSYASYRTGGGAGAAAAAAATTGGRGGGGDAVWDDSRTAAPASRLHHQQHHQHHYPLQQQQQPQQQQQQPAYHPQQYQESNPSRHGGGLHLHRSAGVDTLTTLQDSLPVHITAPERGTARGHHGGAAGAHHDADGDDGGLDDQLPDYVECGPPLPASQHTSAAGGGGGGGNPQEQLRAFASDVRRLMDGGGGVAAAAAASRSGTQASSIQRATLSVPVGGGKSAPSLHHDVDPRHLAELVSIPSTSDYAQQPMQNTLVTNAVGGGAATATNTASAATVGAGGATLEIQSESGARTSLRVPGSVLQSLLRAASAHEEYAAEPDEYPGSPDAAGAGQVPAAPVSSKLPLSTAPSFPFVDDSTARSMPQPILSTPGQQQPQHHHHHHPQELPQHRHAHAPTGLQAPTQQHPTTTQQRAVARPLPPLPDPHYPPATTAAVATAPAAAAAAAAAPPLLARPPVPATPLRAAAAPPSYGRPTPGATTTTTTHQHAHRTPVVDHRRLSPRRGTPSAAAASADTLHNPISVCSSDAGHIIVHGPHGPQHFDLGHAAATGFVGAVRGAQAGTTTTALPPALGAAFSPRDVNTFRRPPPPMHAPPSCSGASERSVWNRSGTADTDFASVTTSLPSMPEDTFLDGCPTQASQQTAAQQQQQQEEPQQHLSKRSTASSRQHPWQAFAGVLEKGFAAMGPPGAAGGRKRV